MSHPKRLSVSALVPVLLILISACAQPATTPTAALIPAVPATQAPAPTSAQQVELNVFAAASLTDAFNEVGKNFQTANPGVKPTFNYAGSQQLAQQIGQGAPGDVFASANDAQMAMVIKSGQVVSGSQRTFARNRLAVIYPKDNRAGILDLKGLAKPGLKLDLAAKEVPVGQYALDFLDKASKDPAYGATFKTDVVKNVVSYEDNVKAVLTKVSLGEADAGIVYTTDITPDAVPKVGRIDIPDTLNTVASYPIAPISNSKNPTFAQKFVNYVLSPDAQIVLVKYGFIPTTGNATGAAPVATPLAFTGLVDHATTFSGDDLKKKTQISVKATDKGDVERTYSGVPIATLLKDAGVRSPATKLVFTGGAGYSQSLSLSDLQTDPTAIIAIADDGSVRNLIPSQLPKFWGKGLVKMDIQ